VSDTLFRGTPFDCKIFHTVSRCRLSKTFLKSITLIYKGHTASTDSQENSTSITSNLRGALQKWNIREQFQNRAIAMRILSRENVKPGIVFNAIFHSRLIIIGIVILQTWPNGGTSPSSGATKLPPYEPVGCFIDKKHPRAFPKVIKKYHINENNLASSLAAIIHDCASRVYNDGFWYFGVEYRSECWTGVNGNMTYNRHGPSENCLWEFKVGSVWTIFVYRFVEGELSYR